MRQNYTLSTDGEDGKAAKALNPNFARCTEMVSVTGIFMRQNYTLSTDGEVNYYV